MSSFSGCNNAPLSLRCFFWYYKAYRSSWRGHFKMRNLDFRSVECLPLIYIKSLNHKPSETLLTNQYHGLGSLSSWWMGPLLKSERKLWKQRFHPLTESACVMFGFARLGFQYLNKSFNLPKDLNGKGWYAKDNWLIHVRFGHRLSQTAVKL